MTMRSMLLSGLLAVGVSAAAPAQGPPAEPGRPRVDRLRERLELTDKQVERLESLRQERLGVRRDRARLEGPRAWRGQGRVLARQDGRRWVDRRVVRGRIDRLRVAPGYRLDGVRGRVGRAHGQLIPGRGRAVVEPRRFRRVPPGAPNRPRDT